MFEIWWSERSKRMDTNKIIIIYIILHEHIDVKQIGLVWSNHQNDMILSLFFTYVVKIERKRELSPHTHQKNCINQPCSSSSLGPSLPRTS